LEDVILRALVEKLHVVHKDQSGCPSNDKAMFGRTKERVSRPHTKCGVGSQSLPNDGSLKVIQAELQCGLAVTDLRQQTTSGLL
jgi:hypothetical protein